MSLLLDALQRASKEKEQLAESKKVRAEPGITTPGPVADPFPSIQLEVASNDPPIAATPELQLEDMAAPSHNFVVAEPVDDIVPPHVGTGVSDPMAEPGEREFAAASRQNDSDVPAETEVRPLDVTGNEANLEYRDSPQRREPAPAPEFDHRSDGRLASEAAAPSPASTTPAGSDSNLVSASDQRSSAKVSPQIAREILGATAKKRPDRRLIILLSLAALVIGSYFAFALGMFDRFFSSPSSSLTPPQPPTSIPTVTPPGTDAIVPGVQPPTSNSEGGTEYRQSQTASAEPKTVTEPQEKVKAKTADAQSDLNEAALRTTVGRRGGSSGSGTGGRDKPLVQTKPPAPGDLDIAYSALLAGRNADAHTAYRKAIEKNPAEKDAFLGLAYLAHREGRPNEAREYYENVLRLEQGNPAAASGLLAIAADGDLALTASRARELAESAPQSAAVLATLGTVLAREGRIAEAQQAYFKALTAEPDNPFHAFNLAVALDKLHKYPQAREYYERAIALAERASVAQGTGLPLAEVRRRLAELSTVRRNGEKSSVSEPGTR